MKSNKRATQEQVEELDRWQGQEWKSFEAIREKCREISGGEWSVTRDLIKSTGIPVYSSKKIFRAKN